MEANNTGVALAQNNVLQTPKDPGRNAVIPLKKIREGFNYRRRYSEDGLNELAESIKQNGLIATVTVRELDDGNFQLLAGGRRYKAFLKAFGEDASIPSTVRVLSDEEATALMMAENAQREDPSIIEDAEGAARMLGLVNGDREEAARRLGWSRNKLDRRLAVMNATQLVRDAYIDGKLKVGHVEILASLRSDVQDRVTASMLKMPTILTVEQLKANAMNSLLKLDTAIFDKAECVKCQYNSGFQQSMFETSFEGSHCSNRECYEKKTETELECRKNKLTETYQVVRIVRPGDNSTVTPLRAEGDKGVGEAQAAACRACADFGACISAVPDKMGKAFVDVCFNKTCNDEKVAANKKATANAKVSENKTATSAKPETVGEKPVTEQKVKAEKPTVSSIRQAVKDYRESVWRVIYKRAATKLAVKESRALLVSILLDSSHYIETSNARSAVSKELGIDFNATSDDVLTQMLQMGPEQLGKALHALPAAVTSVVPINEMTRYLTDLNVNVANYWKLNETFLDILTKTEIDAVCVEIGLDKAIGKTYSSLKAGSKKEMVAALLKVEGFDYIGKVPAMMCWDK